jgi:hypothetical protein
MQRLSIIWIALLFGGLLGVAYAQQGQLTPCVEALWTNCFGEAHDGSKHVPGQPNDKKDGQGTYTYSDGSKYEGEWKNLKRDGQGTYTFSDGGKYVGEWKDGKQDGQGTNTEKNGNKYVGEWKGSNRNGRGAMTFQNGAKYVGEWKENYFNGQGTLYAADGSIFKAGIWDKSVLVSADPAYSRPAPTAPLTSVQPQTSNTVQTKFAPSVTPPATAPERFSLAASKVKCEELGFKPATERFGKCVLQLSK